MDDALERARREGILVARLGEDTWRAQSSEPALRGPYLVVLDEGGGHCECLGGAHREACKHRAAAAAAQNGAYPVSDVTAIHGPADRAPGPPPNAHVYRPPAWVRRRNAEYEAVCADRRAAAPPVTDRDYAELFPD